MKNEIYLNGMVYIFKESFDVNLLLSYENTRWGEWEIVREFVSNALDSVGNDIAGINILKSESSYLIQDSGAGYPVFYAKRIGASNKKDSPDSIGQFGEGTKLAILTAVRNNIEMMLCSQNWLIIPYAIESEGQEVLLYDIYESDHFIDGSAVSIERDGNIDAIFSNLGEYFLAYNDSPALHGDAKSGIYPPFEGICRLYNKGVYIKDINALYSYAVNLEEINRDRNLISNDDLAYKIRDLFETATEENLITSLLEASSLPYEQKKNLIEFQASFYTYYPEVWKEAFQKIYGSNALLSTNDIASREAETLGYIVITGLDYSICRILKEAGIREDRNCLADDFEFVWSETLTREERLVLEQLPRYARLAGFNDLPETIKIFDLYRGHDNVNGVYDQNKEEMYLRRDLLSNGLENALKTFLHESCHHVTKADDLNRVFANTLCEKLTEMLIRYSKDVGVESTVVLSGNTLVLPEEVSLSARELLSFVSVIGNECIVTAGKYFVKIKLKDYLQPLTCKNKITIKNCRFTVTIPNAVVNMISLDYSGYCRCLIIS